MVTLAVAAIVTAIGAGAIAQLTRAQGDYSMDELRVVTTRRSIADWFAGAYASPTHPFLSEDATANGGASDRVRFATRTAYPWVDGDAYITVRMAGGDDVAKGMLVADVENIPGGGMRTVVLADAIAGLDIEYLAGHSFATTWQDNWQSPTETPRAVRIMLDPASGSHVPDLLVLPIIASIEVAQ